MAQALRSSFAWPCLPRSLFLTCSQPFAVPVGCEARGFGARLSDQLFYKRAGTQPFYMLRLLAASTCASWRRTCWSSGRPVRAYASSVALGTASLLIGCYALSPYMAESSDSVMSTEHRYPLFSLYAWGRNRCVIFRINSYHAEVRSRALILHPRWYDILQRWIDSTVSRFAMFNYQMTSALQ